MAQSFPSGEDRMEPFSPTATYWPTCDATPRNVLPCGDGLAQVQFVCACASEQAAHRKIVMNDLKCFIMLPDEGVPDCGSTRSWNEVLQCDAPFPIVQGASFQRWNGWKTHAPMSPHAIAVDPNQHASGA
jgi:hypothetical protein